MFCKFAGFSLLSLTLMQQDVLNRFEGGKIQN
jgi:hypothetical protein